MTDKCRGETEREPDDRIKRKRGILTEADRKFLFGEIESSSEQTDRDRRYRIRERVFHGLLDLQIIDRYLSDRDLEMVLDRMMWDEREAVLGFARRVAEAENEPTDDLKSHLRRIVREELERTQDTDTYHGGDRDD